MDVSCFYLLGQLLHSCGLQALCQGQEQLLYIYPSKLHDYDQFLKWHIIEFFNFKKLIKLKTLVYYCHWFRNGSTKINFTSWKSPSYKRVVVPFMWKIINFLSQPWIKHTSGSSIRIYTSVLNSKTFSTNLSLLKK